MTRIEASLSIGSFETDTSEEAVELLGGSRPGNTGISFKLPVTVAIGTDEVPRGGDDQVLKCHSGSKKRLR